PAGSGAHAPQCRGCSFPGSQVRETHPAPNHEKDLICPLRHSSLQMKRIYSRTLQSRVFHGRSPSPVVCTIFWPVAALPPLCQFLPNYSMDWAFHFHFPLAFSWPAIRVFFRSSFLVR